MRGFPAQPRAGQGSSLVQCAMELVHSVFVGRTGDSPQQSFVVQKETCREDAVALKLLKQVRSRNRRRAHWIAWILVPPSAKHLPRLFELQVI